MIPTIKVKNESKKLTDEHCIRFISFLHDLWFDDESRNGEIFDWDVEHRDFKISFCEIGIHKVIVIQESKNNYTIKDRKIKK